MKKEQCVWKKSRFNVHYPVAEGEVLVINTLRRSIVRLPSLLGSIIREYPAGQSEIDEFDFSLLCDAGMLVPINMDESRVFSDWYERIVSDLSSVRCTIALTSACNLNCAYCFESGALRERVRTMSEGTADSTVKWIAQFLRFVGTENIRIIFYGGEPTLAPQRMIQIVETTRHELETTSRVSFGMYSNGVTFRPELIDVFTQPEFQWAQIALDGPREIHDKRRILGNGQGTFDEIWKNIETLVTRCGVHVRVVANFDRANYREIPRLLEEIAACKWRDGIEVAFNPIFATGLNRNYCSTHNFPEHDSYDLWRGLYEAALKLGLNTSFLRILDKGPCAIHRVGNFYISPDGAVYECIGFLGTGVHQTGCVIEPFTPADLTRRKEWIANNTRWQGKCQECSYLPMCLGGCRFKAFCETRDLRGWVCHQDLIETCELPLAHLAKEYGLAE